VFDRLKLELHLEYFGAVSFPLLDPFYADYQLKIAEALNPVSIDLHENKPGVFA
jgi:hypothetical protein